MGDGSNSQTPSERTAQRCKRIRVRRGLDPDVGRRAAPGKSGLPQNYLQCSPVTRGGKMGASDNGGKEKCVRNWFCSCKCLIHCFGHQKLSPRHRFSRLCWNGEGCGGWSYQPLAEQVLRGSGTRCDGSLWACAPSSAKTDGNQNSRWPAAAFQALRASHASEKLQLRVERDRSSSLQVAGYSGV